VNGIEHFVDSRRVWLDACYALGMFRAYGSGVPRGLARWSGRRRGSRSGPRSKEAGLGSVAAQARRVAGALTLLVLGGVVLGCFGSPRGVACASYSPCGAATSCSECLDVPSCGPLLVQRADACEQSCPIAFECSVSADCPAQIRCDGLVPGRRSLAARSDVAPAPPRR
jgi:hypothetical protein